MEIFSALLAFCAGNSPATGEFPSQRPVTQSFWCYLWYAPEQAVEQARDAGDLRRSHDVTVMSLGLVL